MSQKCKILRAFSTESLEKQINDFVSQYTVMDVEAQDTVVVEGKSLYSVIVMYDDKRIPLVEG